MPLATDFRRGFPPRQDPELKAREHRNRSSGGTFGGEAQQLHCPTTRLQGKAAFIAKLTTAAQDEWPARGASSTKLGAGCQPTLGNAPPPIRGFAAFSNFYLFQKDGYS
jgi:hypothetical protein